MEPKLHEGLDKLKRLDLATWDEIDDEIGISSIWWENIGIPEGSEADFKMEKRILRAIQGLIEDAIAARPEFTGFSVFYDRDEKKYTANIFSDLISIPPRPDSKGGAAAEAILLAYVAALEAQG